ncbi:hypothetical protein [Halobacillus litoralis]|uniref:hypothetical protein n=1 Tax=Halobacillus litoralis TaxID=45668 RepID=UPI001CD2BE94|nr:hypothetical protein [Halobacillus litoralis]MCA1021559.1 hypothetical protein [Halobacillus litoralis]
MQLHSIVQYDGMPVIVQEKCLLTDSGDYVGVESGKTYQSNKYKAMDSLRAKIVSVDDVNNTGMIRLDREFNDTEDENASKLKSKYLGCYVTVRPAHMYGGINVYRCYELDEYFSEYEIELQ